MDISADMPVTLIIKAPNQRLEDQTVDCMIGWTIKKLKRHLESVYPSKPKHNEQRLIYCGKLLQDDLTLKEILRKGDSNDMPNQHTVHLVCSRSHEAATSSALTSSGATAYPSASPVTSTSSKSTPTAASTPSNNITSTTSTSPTAGVYNAHGDGVRYRGTGPTPVTSSGYTQFPQMYPMMQGHASQSNAYPYTPEQYALMMQQQQQMYSQYMMQYMQYYQGMYGSNPGLMPQFAPFAAQMNPIPPQGIQGPAGGQPAQELPRPAPAGDNAAQPNMRMNAQGGMEEDVEDEGDPRDWLHHTYFLMRFLTFLGILFFYSSFSRFILVLGGSFALFLFQKVRRYMRRNERLQEQNRQQQQEQQRQRQQEEERQNDNQAGQENGGDQPRESEANEGNHEDQNGESEPSPNATEQEVPVVAGEGNRFMRLLLFTCNTIQTFFTSLVPAPPELIEAN